MENQEASLMKQKRYADNGTPKQHMNGSLKAYNAREPRTTGDRKTGDEPPDPVFTVSGDLGGDIQGVYVDGYKALKWYHPKVSATEAAFPTRLHHVWLFYANIIDYARVIINLIAGFTMLDYPFFTGVCIIVAQLLDWIDGPVARAYKQGSIFGSGIDWFADVQGQVVTALWWTSLNPKVGPWIFAATTIELGCCIYDFAATNTRYPQLAPSQSKFIYKILEWATPSASYTSLGTFIWLAYPIFCVAHCLDLSWPERSYATHMALKGTENLLLIPSLLYIWNELAQFLFILSHWSEPALRDRPADVAAPYDDGHFAYVGKLDEADTLLIKEALDVMKSTKEWDKLQSGNEVFWSSIQQRRVTDSDKPYMEDIRGKIKRIGEMDAMVDRLIKKCYPFGNDVIVDGYGFICNPPKSRTQSWHLDYSPDHSSVFIPVENVTTDNQTSYMVPPDSKLTMDSMDQLVTNPDKIDINSFLDKFGFVSVRQLIAKPFSLLRMNFGCIHRGISNLAPNLRVVFYFCVVKNSADSPKESVFTHFEKDSVGTPSNVPAEELKKNE